MKPSWRPEWQYDSIDARCWAAATSADRVLEAVETRLIDGGAVIELRQFYGLSAQECDVLLRLEREGALSGCPQASGDEVAA